MSSGKTTAYETGLHVPLIVRCPEVKERGVTNHALTNWADIMPSILEWTGVKGPEYALHGRSWLPILGQSDPAGWDRAYFSHTFHEVIDYYPMRAGCRRFGLECQALRPERDRVLVRERRAGR